MSTRPNAPPSGLDLCLRIALGVNLLLILLTARRAPWHHILLSMPWVFMLASSTLRSFAKKIFHEHNYLTLASLILAILTFSNCTRHECSFEAQDAYLAAIIWLPMAALTCSNSSNRESITVILCIAIILPSVIIFWQLLIEGDPRPRALSFNVLIGPLLMIMMCLLGGIRASLKHTQNNLAAKISVCTTFIGMTAVIATQSRTSLFSFLAAAISFLLTSPPTRWARIALITGTIVIFWFGTQIGRYEEGKRDLADMSRNQNISSIGERADGLKWGLQHLLDQPWTGLGPQELQDRFNLRGHEWGHPKEKAPFIHHLHNDYLQLAVSHGLPAMLCHTTMWLIICKLRKKSSPSREAARPWLIAMSVVYLFSSLTDSFTYWVFTWATAMSCLGIAIGMHPPEIQPTIKNDS
jgi:hypothetical protein